MNDTMLHIHSLSKMYGKQTVLADISLDIPRSSIFALLGPNGSGKTSLIKILLGIVKPTQGGDVTVNGRRLADTSEYKNQLGYMPQSPKFPQNMKIADLLSLFEKLRKKKGIFKEKLIEDFGIDSFWKKSLGELSGGMTQKINLMQAFMFDNAVFLLDEPTQGLDPHAAFCLKRLISERKIEGCTTVFTSHTMSEVEEVADLLALLVEGKIYTTASPDQIKKAASARTLEQALHNYWNSVRKK